VIQREVETELSRMLLRGELREGERIHVDFENGRFSFLSGKPVRRARAHADTLKHRTHRWDFSPTTRLAPEEGVREFERRDPAQHGAEKRRAESGPRTPRAATVLPPR